MASQSSRPQKPDLPDRYLQVMHRGETVELEFLPRTLGQWERVWASRLPRYWDVSHLAAVENWVILLDRFNRGHAQAQRELTALEDRLGMTPKSQALLNIVLDDGDSEGEPDDGGSDFEERLAAARAKKAAV